MDETCIIIDMENKVILVYGLDERACQSLLEYVNKNGYRMAVIDDTNGSDTFALLLAELPQKHGCEKNVPLLLLDGFDQREVQIFYQELMNLGLKFDGILAVTTDENRKWTLEHLYEETMMDHLFMQDVKCLEELLQSFTQADIEEMKVMHDYDAMDVLMKAFEMAQTGQFGKEDLSLILHSLEEIKYKYQKESVGIEEELDKG